MKTLTGSTETTRAMRTKEQKRNHPGDLGEGARVEVGEEAEVEETRRRQELRRKRKPIKRREHVRGKMRWPRIMGKETENRNENAAALTKQQPQAAAPKKRKHMKSQQNQQDRRDELKIRRLRRMMLQRQVCQTRRPS